MGPNHLIGLLASVPHHGAVVMPLSVSGPTHGASYKDIFTVGIPAALIALVIVIMLVSPAVTF